jgi:hypothetical protein
MRGVYRKCVHCKKDSFFNEVKGGIVTTKQGVREMNRGIFRCIICNTPALLTVETKDYVLLD